MAGYHQTLKDNLRRFKIVISSPIIAGRVSRGFGLPISLKLYFHQERRSVKVLATDTDTKSDWLGLQQRAPSQLVSQKSNISHVT